MLKIWTICPLKRFPLYLGSLINCWVAFLISVLLYCSACKDSSLTLSCSQTFKTKFRFQNFQNNNGLQIIRKVWIFWQFPRMKKMPNCGPIVVAIRATLVLLEWPSEPLWSYCSGPSIPFYLFWCFFIYFYQFPTSKS